ncbi:unnamed protein product, partial [marine sediment metagenome]
MGSKARFILVEAPTGSGKSLIAAAWQRLTGRQTLYMCTTKQLQDQVQEDFPYAEVLKGRANYPTRNHPEIACDMCQLSKTVHECDYCAVGVGVDGKTIHDCPYQNAKKRLLAADLGIVNTALFLTEGNYVGRLSGFPQVVLDEADTIEGQLMAFAELRVSKRVIRLLKLEAPKHVTVEEDWVDWAKRSLQRIAECEPLASTFNVSERKSVENLEKRLGYFLNTLVEKNLHWVNCTGKKEHSRGPWTWKPVRVDTQAENLLWQHGDRWLMMSATILSPEQFCKDLGLPRNEVEFIRLPCTFPVEHRPVHYFPIADMTYAQREQSVEGLVLAIDCILQRHFDEKVLIHTVSYWLMEMIFSLTQQRRRIMRFTHAGERASVIEEFRQADNRAVLLAPGLERGLDLPYDDCRVIIIPKLPYPSLADKQVNARLRAYPDGNDWYTLQTARALVQASGRRAN